MEADELLSEIKTRRGSLAETVSSLDAKTSALNGLAARGAARKARLELAVGEYNDHLAARAREVADALADLADAVREGMQDLAAGVAARAAEAAQLSAQLDAEAKAYDEAKDGLEGRKSEVSAAFETGGAMIDTAATASGEAQSKWNGSVRDDLQPAMAGLLADLSKVESEGRGKVRELIDGALANSKLALEDGLRDAMTVTQTRMQSRTTDIALAVERSLSDMLSGQGSAAERLLDEVNAMKRGLESFGGVTRTTAEGMIHASDDARDLLSSTNSGLNVVIGIVEKVTEIMEELRSELP